MHSPMQQGCKTASELKILRSDVACKIDPGDGLSIQLQLHGMASSCSQYSCDLVGSLHKGLQSRAISIVQVITS